MRILPRRKDLLRSTILVSSVAALVAVAGVPRPLRDAAVYEHTERRPRSSGGQSDLPIQIQDSQERGETDVANALNHERVGAKSVLQAAAPDARAFGFDVREATKQEADSGTGSADLGSRRAESEGNVIAPLDAAEFKASLGSPEALGSSLDSQGPNQQRDALIQQEKPLAGFSSRIYTAISDFGSNIAANTEPVKVAAQQYLQTVELRVAGASLVKQSEIADRLPQSKSYAWWLSHQDEIASNLQQHPLIEAASISTCTYSLHCFEINIKERKPALWVKSANTRMLVSLSGTVLLSLDASDRPSAMSDFDRSLLLRLSQQGITDLPVLDARDLTMLPDASDSLFRRTLEIVEQVERSTDLQVYGIKFVSGNEAEVEFNAQPFKVLFNVDSDELFHERIEVQAIRLKKILAQHPQVSARASLLQLGLEKEVVAKLDLPQAHP